MTGLAEPLKDPDAPVYSEEDRTQHYLGTAPQLEHSGPPAPLRPHLEPRPQSPGRMLSDVARFVRRFVSFQTEAQAVAVVLWIVHTHAFRAAETTARLAIQSAEKQSGKTRLLEVLELLVVEPWSVANITPAAMFRVIAEYQPTLLIDEIDAVFSPKANGASEDLRAILNAGYRKVGGTVARVVGEGKKMKVEKFPCFAPVALAGLGGLPDTIQDRSIPIKLKRRSKGEEVDKLRRRDVVPDADQLRAQIVGWVEAHLDELVEATPEVPDVLPDRAADIWEPLLAIADAAGGNWPGRARTAAVALNAAPDDVDESLNVRLLADVRSILEHVESGRIASVDLVGRLQTDEETPWDDRLTPGRLALRLRSFGIRPHAIREGSGVFKGYQVDDFADAWDRYLSGTPENSGYTVTPVTTEASTAAGCNRETGVTGFSGVREGLDL
ncbi:MAG: DUF3631 domain-containing protein [Actinomycetota bacterium]|nr:DUF3631 domain-containing protein [Actinomycetota bacterium]